MQVALDPRLREAATSARRRSFPTEGDYRVKIFKAASRSARDEVERADAALAEQHAAERQRSLARREAEVRGRGRS